MPKVKCTYCNREEDASTMHRCRDCERWICSKCIKFSFIGYPQCPKNSTHTVEKG
jgi:hypothetical protein